MEKLEKILGPMATALNNNKVIQSISKGLMSMMPILMIGAFGSLFQQLPIGPYQTFIQSSGLYNIFGTAVNITTNMLALYAVFSISYNYVKNEDMDGFAAGLISLCAFFMVTPMNTVGEGFMAVTNLPLNWLGAKGLFTAMIVAAISSKVYCLLIKKNITIKLPDSVPSFVSKSFSGIIPGILIVAIFAAVSAGFSCTSYGDMHDAIYTLIATPLNTLGGSIWAALIIYTLSGLCWFFGIHGIAVVSVVMPIWMAADAANIAAISAGGTAENIVTYNWINAVGNIGGAGATLGLVILCTFFAKSKQYREFGKIAIVPSLFNINEPVVFGLPCMFNTILAIPFIFLPVVLVGIAYLLTIAGILPVGNGIGAPAGTPIIISGMFNGGWRIAAFQIVAFVVSIVTYLPFFKILDKKAIENEKKLEASQVEND